MAAARPLGVFAAAVAAVLLVVSPALASLGNEVSAGRAVAAQLQNGTTRCDALSDADFGHLGEYLMDRMVGSRAAHEAVNGRMTRAIGTENTDRMHEVLGRDFDGCASGAAASVPMGPWMMGGSNNGAASGMTGGAGWGWMQTGSWQHMSQSQWRDLAGAMMGSRYTSGRDGWSAGAVVAVVLAAVLLGAALAVLLVRRPWHRRPPSAPSAA